MGSKLKNLYLIIGESGSGKDSVVDFICGLYRGSKVASYTTRPKRLDEEDTHIFVTESQFQKLDNLVATTHFHGYEYGATAEQVDNADFYIIDKHGIESFQKNYTGDRPYHIIYITAPRVVRATRMQARGDDTESVCRRLEHDDVAFNGVNDIANTTIVNTNLHETIEAVCAYVVHQELIAAIGDIT